jgi:hypothetical protein
MIPETDSSRGLTTAALTRLADELNALLGEAFDPQLGLYRQGVFAGVSVTSASGASPGQVDLSVFIFPCLRCPPASSVEWQEDGVSLELCLRVLRSPRPQMRASACQLLGHLGREEAADALRNLAREDPDPHVREVAAAALERLPLPRFAAETFAGLELRLLRMGPGEPATLGSSRTDDRGHAGFAAVPAQCRCALELVLPVESGPMLDVWRYPSAAPEERWLEFDATSPARGRIGPWELEIAPQGGDASDCFDAVLRFCRAEPPPEAVVSSAPVAQCGRHVYHASEAQLASGLAVFRNLPLGTYLLHWPAASPPAAAEPALHARSAGAAPGSLLSACQSPAVIVHPADRRLLAVVEPDRSGRVVLTLETDCPELQGAKVRYRVLDETGELRLEPTAGAGVWRGVRYLCQPYTAQSPLALDLHVLS